MLSNRLIVLVVLAIVVVYGLIEAYPLLAGPQITLTSPTNGQVVTDPVILNGTAIRAASLTLDGTPITPDENGTFSTTLAFPAGADILTLTAHDRFGHSATITRTIVVQ